MTVLAVDASVLVKLVVDEGNREAVLEALGDSDLVAPALCRIEVSNILWKKCRLGHITSGQAERALEVVDRRSVRMIEDRPFLPAALSLALLIDHPVYDCLYLIAARQAAAKLVTADTRLSEGARRTGIEVCLVR